MAAIGPHFIPAEILKHTFSPIDILTLGKIQTVCSDFNKYSNEILWPILDKVFRDGLNIPLQNLKLAKDLLKNCAVRNEKELRETVITFLCWQKYLKKTSLQIVFPHSSFLSIASHNLTIHEPTPFTTFPSISYEFFIGYHSLEYYKFTEPSNQKRFCYINDAQSLKTLTGGGDYFFKNKSGHILFRFNTELLSNIPLPPDWIELGVMMQNIEGVDVGYGNCLGYYSSIDQWKEPFRLFCGERDDGSHFWFGRMPHAPAEIKFVKMVK